MYKEIVETLENNCGLYYKIKNKEEAIRIANELIWNDYLIFKKDFVDSFDAGNDCFMLYGKDDYERNYLLINEDCASEEKIKYEPTETIINPTYDDLLPLFSDTDSDDLDEVCSKPEIGGKKIKKDLIEIVTTDDVYYVKCFYETLKLELEYIGSRIWMSFDEVYELQDWSYDGFEKTNTYTKSDKEELLLKIEHIISIAKLHEGDDED